MLEPSARSGPSASHHPISVPAYLVLGALTMITPLATNMYVPALPALAAAFGSTAAVAQFTVSATLIGIVLGQLVIGSISDRVGRRAPALIGTAMFVIASVLCAFAPNMPALIAFRVLQGFAGASGVVLARASIRDRVEGRQAAQALSRLLIVAAIGPVIGPFLGSLALRVTDWRGVFLSLAAAGAIAFALSVRWFPETLKSYGQHATGAQRRGDAASPQSLAWHRLVRDRRFWGYVIVAGLLGTVTFTWLTMGSFFMSDIYALDATPYAMLVGFTSLCFLVGAWLNSRAVMRIGPRRALLRGLLVIAVGSGVILAVALLHLPFPVAVLGIAITFASYGGMIANAQALGMAAHGEAAGSASAFLGASQFLLGAFIPPIVTLAFGVTWAMPAAMIGASALAFIIVLWMRRPAPSGEKALGGHGVGSRDPEDEAARQGLDLDADTAL